MDVNSTSTYVNKASSNKGFSGLASGMDTESMVEQMLSGTQNKIDKQNATKQQLEWKQEIYRDIISQINTFQNQFFSFTSDTNFLTQSFFNAMSAISASKAFKVTATSSATTGSTSMEVRRLATNSSISSGANVSGKLAGKIDMEALTELAEKQMDEDGGYVVKFQVGDKTVEADLRDIFVDGNSFRRFSSTAQRDAEIEAKLSEAFSDTGVKVAVRDGAVSLVDSSEPPKTIEVSTDSGAIALQRLGLSAGSRSTLSNDKKSSSLSGKVNEAPTLSFTVTLDDLKKDVKIDLRDVMNADGSVDLDKFKTSLQKSLDNVHGKNQVRVISSGDSFELSVSDGRKVTVNGDKDLLGALGVRNGQSNRIEMGTALKDLYFVDGLQGSHFQFTINGEQFSFSENDTLIDIMDAINSSDAGVRLVYRTQADTFTLEATDSGAGRTITMTQQEGNFLNVLFGAGGADSALLSGTRAVSGLTKGEISGDITLSQLGLTGLYDKNGKAISGSTKLSELTEKVDDLSYLSGDTTLSQLGLTELYDKDGKELAQDTKLSELTDGAESPIYVTAETTLGQLGLTGLTGKDGSILSADTKLSQLGELTNELTYENGQIVLTGSGANVQVGDADTMQKLFGKDSLSMGVASGAASKIVEGENALVKIDGMLTERSSNAFSVNGLSFSLQSITGTYAAASGDLMDSENNPVLLQPGQYVEDGVLYDKDGSRIKSGITYQGADGFPVTATGISYDPETGGARIFTGETEKIEVSRNTDQIVDGIKQFMDSYNKLVKTLNDYLNEDANYRDYAPLTADQKKEMSEREIELWEEKAKEGLLRRDSTIDGFLQSMRTVLYQKPAGCRYALYELGIETGEWETRGQLQFSTDGEERLRQILETDPSSVMQLFTDSENGLAVKLNEVIKAAANTSAGSPGSLVEIAGVKGKASEKDNTIYNRLKEIENRISALKLTYEKEKTRYWNQFNTMEQMIANMSSQSAYLTQMMGY